MCPNCRRYASNAAVSFQCRPTTSMQNAFCGHSPHRSYRSVLADVKPTFVLASPHMVIRFQTKLPSVLLAAVRRIQTPRIVVQESGDHEMGPNNVWAFNRGTRVCQCVYVTISTIDVQNIYGNLHTPFSPSTASSTLSTIARPLSMCYKHDVA